MSYTEKLQTLQTALQDAIASSPDGQIDDALTRSLSQVSQILSNGSSGSTGASFSANNTASATNAAATITYNAVAGKRHAIDGISFSLSADPASPVALTITDAGNTVFQVDVLVRGPGFIPISGASATANTSLVISLGAGGSGVVGKISAIGYRQV